MKIIALTIVVLIALIAFGGSLASNQTGIVTSILNRDWKLRIRKSYVLGQLMSSNAKSRHSWNEQSLDTRPPDQARRREATAHNMSSTSSTSPAATRVGEQFRNAGRA
jgi:hypothetical protein